MVEECIQIVEEVKLAKITLAEEGENKHKCSSCTLYVVLYSIIFTLKKVTRLGIIYVIISG